MLRTLLAFGFWMGIWTCSLYAQNQRNANNLINETSPYLLQHAYNPVAWNRWEPRSLKQNDQDRLLIISIGYSSCHWCHVMEEETFSDDTVAALMNENFINIKVDREENPDVDQLYMRAVQLMTGTGGWPLNVVALPDGRPIFAGTYFEKDQWVAILEQLIMAYKNDKDKLYDFAAQLAEGISDLNPVINSSVETDFEPQVLDAAMLQWTQQWDQSWGGLTEDRQKFIQPGQLQYLMQYAYLSHQQTVDDYIENSLEIILQSGIVDQLNGGFYRYSTDPYWQVPHFEKMLYDQGLMLSFLAAAHQRYKSPLVTKQLNATFDFLVQSFQNPEGGFSASFDADTPLGEGGYYLFTSDEIQQVAQENLKTFCELFKVDLSTPTFENKFHLQWNTSASIFGTEGGIGRIEDWISALKNIQQARSVPKRDDKIVLSWNAMVLKGFVRAYQATSDQKFLEAAIQLCDFINQNMTKGDLLFHTFQNGKPAIDGYLEDYAFYVEALLALYETTANTDYLTQATVLTQKAIALFEDQEQLFFNFKSEDDHFVDLILVEDGVIPSANAVMAENLFRLGTLLDREEDKKRVVSLLQNMQPSILVHPSNYYRWANLWMYQAHPFYEIVIVGQEAQQKTLEFGRNFLPNALFQFSEKASALPLLEDRYFEGETYIYVCQNKVCNLPVMDVKKALDQLHKTEQVLFGN
ncbi:MAG: thioredoxin domain-containing protein [Flavobacteriaceae bacterium]|nr:thioredoxin domain-containing protein [Flavobacteriaceae bacterium]